MKIIIPMSGYGERFRRAGYQVPKPLIQVNKYKMIEHVIRMFSKEDEFIFICNKDHLEKKEWELEKTISESCHKYSIVPINAHKLGPVYAVLMAKDFIEKEEPVVVNYCDFSCYWDWNKFQNDVLSKKCVGAIPAYKGFHPHTLGTTNYAYIKEENNMLIDIKEKEPFTKNRMNEYASSGTYYFSKGEILINSFEELLKRNLNVNGEFYVSLAYKIISENYKNIYIYPLQHFMQWGTPQDLEEFQYWENIFKKLSNKNHHLNLPNNLQKGTLIIPMAGLGKRFADQGYKKTKPLIEVSGKPMVTQSINDLPRFENQIIILREDMPEYNQTASLLKTEYPNVIIKTIPGITKGQAITTLEGINALPEKSNKFEPITVSACDNGVIFNYKKFEKILADTNIDIIVWGAEGYANAIRNPKMYGWIDNDKNDFINKVSVKKPIESNKNKPIIIGTFTFKKSNELKAIIEKLIDKKDKVNGEYYLDSCINTALELGLKCKYFPVDHYICWGTPNDLKTFEYWQSCFHKWDLHKYKIELDSDIPKSKIEELKKNFYKS